MVKYEIILYWSNEDRVFVAEVPELPGCMAHGDTQETALTNVKEATQDSDWDILVLSKTVTSELKHNIRTAIFDIELEEGVIINLLILPRDEWENGRFRNHPLRRNVEAEGILI